MGHVERSVNQFGFPRLSRVRRLAVTENAHSVSFASFIPATMERRDNQLPHPGCCLQPTHPVHGWLMHQFNRVPSLGPVGWWNQVEDRATVNGITWIPPGSHGDF